MKAFIETYGCAFNRVDSDSIVQALQREGTEITTSQSDAEVIIINSCGVKNATESRILHRLRQLAKKRVPTVVTGCLAQATPERISKANPVACIVGTYSQTALAKAVRAAFKGKQFRSLAIEGFLPRVPAVHGVTATIQIARGCLGSCSFCQTRLARGRLESIPPKQVVQQCETALAKGAKEIHLTAQDTAGYGLDCNTTLAELLNAMTALPVKFRVRVGMANPEHILRILPELLDAFDNPKIYKFVHAPLQSGSNIVLKAMNRNHSAEDFLQVASAFHNRFKECTIVTDAITGFPTETEDDFNQTLKVIKKAAPDVVNVSRYSPRPNTAAAALKLLPDEVVSERTRRCAALCNKMSLRNRKKKITRQTALVTQRINGNWIAHLENYYPIPLKKATLGEFVKICPVTAADALEGSEFA